MEGITPIEALYDYDEEDDYEDESNVTQQLIEAIDNLYGQETPNREQKIALIQQISENLVEEIDAYLQAEEINSRIYAEFHGNSPKEFLEGAHLRGELFERLASAEYVSDPPEIGEEILSLMRNPDRFNFLEELGYVRNPDLAVVELNAEGNLTILQAGDAKLGTFNYRMYRQFKDSGFKAGMETMAEAINSTSNLAEHGLESLQVAKDIGSKIEISPDYSQYVIVPYDRDVDNPESLIKKSDFRNPAEYEDFKKMLENEDITVVPSIFTTQEVYEMSKVLEDLIDRRRFPDEYED